jgi:hypothetical protein
MTLGNGTAITAFQVQAGHWRRAVTIFGIQPDRIVRAGFAGGRRPAGRKHR